MKKIRLLSIALFFSVLVIAQGTYLEVPVEYFRPLYGNEGCESISQPKVPKYTPWIVFSQESQNAIYSNSGLTNQITRVDLGKEFVVINRQGTNLEVVELDKIKGAWEKTGKWQNKYASDNPIRGWISMNKVMTSISCQQICRIPIPRTPSGMYPLKVVYKNVQGGNNDYMNFYSTPCGNQISSSLDPTEIYGYVYKELNCGGQKWYLIGNKDRLNALDKGKDVLLGWKSEDGIIMTFNLAYEFNWTPDAVAERENNNLFVKAWEDGNSIPTVLQPYKNDTRGFPIENPRYSRRAPGYRLDARFPILKVEEMENGRINKATIGRLLLYGDDTFDNYCGLSMSDRDIAFKAFEIVGLLKKEAQTINLVFVIDATGSMLRGERRAVVLNSINEALGDLRKKINDEKLDITVNVGACLYRDAASEAGGISYAVEMCDLNPNFRNVISWLETHLVRKGCDRDQPEAYFYGLDSAFNYFSSKMGINNTNYFIALGDAGNHNRTHYTDCNGRQHIDYTRTSFSEVAEFLDGKSLDDLIVLQYNRDVKMGDSGEAVDSFYNQTNRIIEVIGNRNNENIIQEDEITRTESGTSYFVYPERGSDLNDQVLSDEIKKAIENSSKSLHRKVKILANVMRNEALINNEYKYVYNNLEEFVCVNAILTDGRSYCFCPKLKDKLMQYILAILRLYRSESIDNQNKSKK
jgi:hypothetical protein